ncbi:hypothetical protein FWF74_01615, partial [Candidatus Saccharibacteria bacterium]|nr:hypothetical protein [Candidatus Saccharibacteria bacterium]
TETGIYADNSGNSPSINNNDLTVTVPSDIANGTYTLTVTYRAVENETANDDDDDDDDIDLVFDPSPLSCGTGRHSGRLHVSRFRVFGALSREILT